ncbi:MAG: NfeD family protein [Brevinematia bacterium]
MEDKFFNIVTNITNNITNFLTNSMGTTSGFSGFEYWVWASIGTFLFVLEIFIPGFIFFWFGLSAIFVSILSLFLLKSLELQLISWMVLSLVFVFSFFYYKNKKYKGKIESEDPIFKYVGIKGEIIQPIVGTKMGRVRLDKPINGIFEWNAISEKENEEINVGERVEVVAVDGIKLVVKKIYS